MCYSSKHIKDLAESHGFCGIIAGTPKTTPGIYFRTWSYIRDTNENFCPGFRLVEKYGMLVGGIDPHRFDLSSMIVLVIPIPHGRGTGPITAAIAHAREVGGFSLRLDVEGRDEDEANKAIAAGADIVMLNNIEGSELGSVARRLPELRAGEGKKFLLETSG
jgi:nicotinate-nucleotide pyrophosphorylase (carboxylating)